MKFRQVFSTALNPQRMIKGHSKTVRAYHVILKIFWTKIMTTNPFQRTVAKRYNFQGIPMTSFIHHAKLLQFAQDAVENEKPWLLWQYREKELYPGSTVRLCPPGSGPVSTATSHARSPSTGTRFRSRCEYHLK